MRRVGHQHQRRLRSYGFSFGEERRRIVGARSPYFGLPQSNQVEVATILCLHDTLRVVCECVGVHSYKKLSVRDYEWESVNTKLWERLCEIVESSNTLKTLAVKYYKEAPTDVPLAILFYHLKSRRSSLDRLVLDIFRHDQYQTLMLDVRYFIEHHPTSILDVRCVISTQLHIQNVRALLEGLNLNKLDWDNVIGNAIDYEPITDWSGIKSVKKLSMNRVRYQFEVSSVANLLRNHDVPVKELVIQGELPMGPDGCAEMIRELADSLRGNTSVRTLFLSLHCPNLDAMENELLGKKVRACFGKLLCDTSSIDSIIRSNHSLVSIQVYFHRYGYAKWVDLNCSRNKRVVVRRKIFKFYFDGEFSVVPFQNMALSVLPLIMTQIRRDHREPTASDDTYQLSAVFRMMRSIPGLCDVSGRPPNDVYRRYLRRVSRQTKTSKGEQGISTI